MNDTIFGVLVVVAALAISVLWCVRIRRVQTEYAERRAERQERRQQRCARAWEQECEAAMDEALDRAERYQCYVGQYADIVQH